MIQRAMGLRLRLTLTFALFCAAILALLGVVFRETLAYTLRQNAAAVLEEEWGAMRAYLRIEKQLPVWYYDRGDNEEAAVALKFRQGLFLVADRRGRVLEVSEKYRELGVETPEEIQALLAGPRTAVRERRIGNGVPHLLRSGIQTDDEKRPYFVAIGRSLEAEETVLANFTRRYVSFAPALILALSVASWWAAGRALQPLNRVAQTAQSISGENLGLRIEPRGAGDELDHLIGAFNSMVDRLQSSFNQIRQFSMDVSHELRTPLTAIRGQLEVALITSDSKEHYRDAMVSAMEDVDRLTQVVRALLHLSQAESGQVKLAFEPVDLALAAGNIAEQFEIPAETENLTLETHLEPQSTVMGDRIQIDRLLSNLLSNAIKYTPAGGTIRVTAVGRGADVELCVEDTGRGIPPEHLPHIFDRFYRVPDGVRDPDKGLGLGLSFVAWIVKAHNARIHVDSTPGQGTRFVVTFAAAQRQVPTSATAQPDARIVA